MVLRVLIDMDGTIANTDKAVQEGLLKFHNMSVDLSERKGFEYDTNYEPQARDVMSREGFFLGLEPIEGAIEGVKGMAKVFDVWFCTSPLRDYKYCVTEKYDWIKKHFGVEWTRKIIIIKDKTLVQANVLIDDRQQTGLANPPDWEQVYFTQPYNKDLKNVKRLDKWEDWSKFLGA
jgi:5'-nucleotidase